MSNQSCTKHEWCAYPVANQIWASLSPMTLARQPAGWSRPTVKRRTHGRQIGNARTIDSPMTRDNDPVSLATSRPIIHEADRLVVPHDNHIEWQHKSMMTRAVARLVMVSHITSRLLKYFTASQTTCIQDTLSSRARKGILHTIRRHAHNS